MVQQHEVGAVGEEDVLPGLEGEYAPEYLVEPEHIREGMVES